MRNRQARRSIPPTGDAAPAWDIAVPSRPLRLPGVTMAGFSDRAKEPVDLQVVPYPAVTLFIDLGDGVLIDHANGRQQRGSLVARLAPGQVRGHGQHIECLQVRLSPLVAHAVLGASSELGGTVVALEDLWGRDAARTQERLRAAGSWDERFAITEATLVRRHQAGRGSTGKLPWPGGRW